MAEYRRLLAQIYERRKELLAQRDQLREVMIRLDANAVGFQTLLVPINKEAEQLNGQIATLNQKAASLRSQAAANPVTSIELAAIAGQISSCQSKLQSLERQAAPIWASLNASGREFSSRQNQMNNVRAQSDQLRIEWLRFADPFAKLSRGEHEEAMLALTEWILLDDEFALAYVCRGIAQMQLGYDDKALQDIEKALSLEPKGAEALATRALLYHKQGDKLKRRRMLEKAALANKKSFFVCLCRGIIERDEKNYKKALMEFRRASEFYSYSASARTEAALLLAASPDATIRNGKSAVENATKACELTGWKAWGNLDVLAAAQAESGDFPGALVTLKRTEAVAPADAKPILDERRQLYESRKPFRL